MHNADIRSDKKKGVNEKKKLCPLNKTTVKYIGRVEENNIMHTVICKKLFMKSCICGKLWRHAVTRDKNRLQTTEFGKKQRN